MCVLIYLHIVPIYMYHHAGRSQTIHGGMVYIYGIVLCTMYMMCVCVCVRTKFRKYRRENWEEEKNENKKSNITLRIEIHILLLFIIPRQRDDCAPLLPIHYDIFFLSISFFFFVLSRPTWFNKQFSTPKKENF